MATDALTRLTAFVEQLGPEEFGFLHLPTGRTATVFVGDDDLHVDPERADEYRGPRKEWPRGLDWLTLPSGRGHAWHASLRAFSETHPHPEVRDTLLDVLGDPDDTHRFMPLMRRLGLSEVWFTWRRREIRRSLQTTFSVKGEAAGWGWRYLDA